MVGSIKTKFLSHSTMGFVCTQWGHTDSNHVFIILVGCIRILSSFVFSMFRLFTLSIISKLFQWQFVKEKRERFRVHWGLQTYQIINGCVHIYVFPPSNRSILGEIKVGSREKGMPLESCYSINPSFKVCSSSSSSIKPCPNSVGFSYMNLSRHTASWKWPPSVSFLCDY